MKKKLLFVFSVISLFLIVLFFGNNRETEKDLLFKGNSFIDGLRIVHKKDGKNVWTLNAKRADFAESEDKARLRNVAITVENKEMTIHAENGLYDLESRNLTLNGEITAVAKDYTIIADSMEWDQSREEMKTKGNVKVESKKFNVEGSGMEVNSEQKVRILKDVKATFYH